MKKILFVLLIIISATLIFASNVTSNNAIQWQPYSKVFALAQKSNKLVYVYIESDTCYYCKKMEQETFSDKNVITLLNSNYIPTEINIDKESALAAQFNVQATPVSIFISPNQKIIGQVPGYLPSKDFTQLLNYVTKKFPVK